MTDKEETSHSPEFLSSEAEFFSTYWEKLPCHISRSEFTHFSELLSPTDIEELLVSQDLFFPTFQVIESDRTIAVGDFTSDDGRVLPQRVMQHYHDGATLILSQASTRTFKWVVRLMCIFPQQVARGSTLTMTPTMSLSCKCRVAKHFAFIHLT